MQPTVQRSFRPPVGSIDRLALEHRGAAAPSSWHWAARTALALGARNEFLIALCALMFRAPICQEANHDP